MKFRYLLAMRSEYREQFLMSHYVEAEDKTKAYNSINNIRRSQTSKSTFEASRLMTDEIEEKFNALMSFTQYTTRGWDETEYKEGQTYEQLHKELYQFLRCPRDRDYLRPKLKEIATEYGNLPVYATGGYPIVYYLQDEDELIHLCGRCANKEATWNKINIVAYDVLEGDTRDHGEIFCEECETLITSTEFEVKVFSEDCDHVLYRGENGEEAYKMMNAAMDGSVDVRLFQDDVQVYPEIIEA